MDYIEGASLGELLVLASKANEKVPARVVVRILLEACAGLHAAHELLDEKGRPVGLVHRDVSPQNLLIGIDGATRVSDFGVAKATAMAVTNSGMLKGKLAYMSPEYVQGRRIDRRVDVFALGVVGWEALAGKRLFRGENEVETAQRIMTHEALRVSAGAPELAALDDVFVTALDKDPERRFSTTRAFAAALESCAARAGLVASHAEVSEIVKRVAATQLEARRAQVRERLASEPGFLSLMGAEPPSIPSSVPSSAPSAAPAAVATTEIDAPVLIPNVAAPAHTAVYGSAEPTTSDALAPAGVPSRARPLTVVVVVAGIALLAGASAVVFATHKPPPVRAAASAESPLPTASIAEPAIASLTFTAHSADVASATASMTTRTTRPRLVPSATATATATTPAATASGPPPNPYL